MKQPAHNAVSVVPCTADERAQWQSFLQTSNNGTLFHELGFLAYHPAGRFREQPLLFYLDDVLAGIMPAAVVAAADGTTTLQAAYGGSIGGLVLPVGQAVGQTIELCRELTRYARQIHCTRVEMRLGPSYYDRVPNEALPFALSCAGFVLAQRWICPAIAILPGIDPLEYITHARRRGYVRAALRNAELKVVPAGGERLNEFYEVLVANRARHGAVPTHSRAELEWLLTHLPERIRLFVCLHGDRVIGGTVMFDLNERVSYSFYPCHDSDFEANRPAAFTLYCVLETYTAQGFRYVDLGPTGNVNLANAAVHLNEGNLRFKQEMGGVGFCRDLWRWTASPNADSP